MSPFAIRPATPADDEAFVGSFRLDILHMEGPLG
jgi:hypothetical protein